MIAYYDTIAEQYKKSKELPYRLIEEYTYFNLLGELRVKIDSRSRLRRRILH